MGRQWAVAIAGCIAFAAPVEGAGDGVTVEISLRSMSDSSPIRGAELVMERLDQGSSKGVPSEDVDDRVITRAHSNERGEIVLRELPAVPMRLKLKAEGYVLPKLDDLAETRLHHRVDLLLPPAIEVRGRVVDDTGKPLPDVKVELPFAMASNGRIFAIGETLSATTDASGQFRIERAPEGIGKFSASVKGHVLLANEGMHYLGARPVSLVVRRTGVLRVDIDAPLHLRGQYSIKVQRKMDQGGLELIQEKPGVDRGIVSFADLPAGTYLISAAVSGRELRAPLAASVEIPVGETAEVRLVPMK